MEHLPDEPKVSVVLSSYNYERYVEEAIQSVFQQTYRNVELIVVDDGSTDQSPEIIQSALRDAPMESQAIYKENAGQASALNAGIDEAGGDLVAFLDSDDYWLPNKLEDMVAFIRQVPDGGVYQHQVMDQSGHSVRKLTVSGDLCQVWRSVGRLNLAVRHDLLHLNMPTSALMFRRSILEQLTPIPESLVVCPDWYLFTCGCTMGNLYTYPKALGVWREHGDKASDVDKFSFKNYWIPVLIPEVNASLARRGIPISFTFRRYEVFLEPFRLIREAAGRHWDRLQKKRVRM